MTFTVNQPAYKDITPLVEVLPVEPYALAKAECCCNLCRARELGISSKEVYFGVGSTKAQLSRANPTLDIYQIEEMAR